MHPHTNRLARETSPYLLQHAHNPVDWYPWSEEAFEKAAKEDKPVLVSIGYAACHWCHVMERESFEDPKVAEVMNEYFINIKVDREERPDVDHIYMDAVQAISGSGGWPLNVFLTQIKDHFTAVHIFPPKRAFNRASWTEVLLSIAKAYSESRDEIDQQASNLTQHLKASNSFGITSGKTTLTEEDVSGALNNILKAADTEWGGFGREPKFPQTFTITFLLRYAHTRKNEAAKEQGLLSLRKMMQGGIYDQVGGGFARYSTDREWLVPHFEKMLYDNALLVMTLAEAYQLTGDEAFREVIDETLAFVERELMDAQGGFYSALDADSEGEEGRFYVWDHASVAGVLGPDAAVFCRYFDITPSGNWEGKNIPWVRRPAEVFALKEGIDPVTLKRIIHDGKARLLAERSGRVRPQLDDKVLLGWNALMNIAYSRAYAATGQERYRQRAETNMNFLLSAFRSGEGGFHHTWKEGRARYPAFLDDHANLIWALIELVQVTGKLNYLDEAVSVTGTVLQQFEEEEAGSPFFYYTHKHQKDVPLRKKEIFDGATPSCNSVMAYNLYRLSILADRPEWRERAGAMVNGMGEAAAKYPTSFGHWLCLLFEIFSGTAEVAIIGKEWKNYLEKINRIYISHKLALATEDPLPGYPLLADKPKTDDIQIYLCENYACRQPVSTIQEFVNLLNGK